MTRATKSWTTETAKEGHLTKAINFGFEVIFNSIAGSILVGAMLLAIFGIAGALP